MLDKSSLHNMLETSCRVWRLKLFALAMMCSILYLPVWLGFRIVRLPAEKDTNVPIRFENIHVSQRYRAGDVNFYRETSGRNIMKMANGEAQRERNLVSELLTSNSVYNIVHYVWCDRKIFAFQHYLSVLSVIKAIVPDRIVFHYANYPRNDNDLYNTWFADLKAEFPFMYLDEIKKSRCDNESAKVTFIKMLLAEDGGIYVHHNTILQTFPIEYRMWPITDALTIDAGGFLVVRRGAYNQKQPVNTVSCSPLGNFSIKSVCTTKTGPFYPRDAWYRADQFSRLVRYLMYGSHTLPTAVSSSQTLVPLIGHMVSLGGGPMDFLFYLSCLSQIHILRVDALYIHGDRKPTGPYWNEIDGMQQVKFVRRPLPDHVFRNPVRVRQHMADVCRFDVLSKYGGIYTDVDAVWVNPLPARLRTYDAVASYDWPQMYNNFPDYVNIGVMLGRSGAAFWREVLHSMKVFKDDMFGYNGLLRPYKLLERRPDLVHIDDYLQVMCWKLNCHPTWYSDFRNSNSSHLHLKGFNWREAVAFHWTSPPPNELMNITILAKSKGMFAEIGQHILKSAGKL